MAEDFLEELYREADAYTFLNNLVRDYRNGNSDSNFLLNINKYIQIFTNLSKRMRNEGDNTGEMLWDEMVPLTRTSSMTVCLDILEGKVLPIIQRYLKNQPEIEVDDEKGTIFKSSDVGFLYQIDSETMSRRDSAVNPLQEAYEIVKDFYHPSKYKYIMLGAGLGYIPYQLYLQSDGEVEITIYFHDNQSYEYAKLYGVLEWIPEDCLNVVISDDILIFLYGVKNGCDDFYVYKPEAKKYPLDEAEVLEQIIITQNTRLTTNKFVLKNYFRNSRRVDKYIYDYDKTELTDKFLIIAGGPSVDENIDFIRDCKKNGINIISVGTVFKKLLAMNIRPDIVTACDPFVSVSEQFINIDDNMGVPFFLGMETDFRAAKEYRGPKFFYPTLGVSQQILEIIKDKIKDDLFPAGTTVTSFSYCVAASLGAKEIYLVGADFGFPGGLSHASDTNELSTITKGTYKTVLANDGQMIEASPQMVLYREEMEGLVEMFKRIKTYNLSRHGAKIKGVKMYSL